MKKLLFLLSFIGIIATNLKGQEPSIAELLGFDVDAKLLIMHADDLGVAHAVNQASIEAFSEGRISSSSIMVPCPWFSEIASYASAHPELCWGLHLTLTSEWKHYKWDGVASSDKIQSLLNKDGVLYSKVIDFVTHAKHEEVETELRAQINKAIGAGINVSHLDSHMGALFTSPELFSIYVKLGNEFNLPVMIPGPLIPPSWNVEELMGPVHQPLDNLIMMGQMVPDWTKMYDDMIEKVVPGLNEIIVHLGYDDAEMQAIMTEHPDFGASWRQKDLNYVLSDGYKANLIEQNIHLVSWKQIRDAKISQLKN